MSDIQLLSSKISALPTETSWSQIYNAGNVYVILSLESKDPQKPLQALGKELISTLEGEYFSLETKNFSTIKKALSSVLEVLPDDTTATIVACAVVAGIVYVFAKGQGYIYLRRSTKIVPLLEPHDDLHGASGTLKHNDFLSLGTTSFYTLVPKETVFCAKDSADLSELATPLVQNQPDGTAAGVGIWVKDTNQPIPDSVPQIHDYSATKQAANIPDTAVPQVPEPTETLPNRSSRQSSLIQRLQSMVSPVIAKLGLKRTFLLLLAIGLVVILISSVVSALQSRQSSQYATQFQEVYPPALKKYNEGKALLTLNKSLANDDFLSAKKQLEDNKLKFPEGTPERQQIDSLLVQITSLATEDAQTIQPKEVSSDSSPLLAAALAKPTAQVSQDEAIVYTLTNDGISKNDSPTTLVKKDWDKSRGFAAYGGNFYLLDGKTVLKFTPATSGYGRNTYVQGDVVLANAVSIAVDGSVFVLSADGSILKFTKGIADPFSITGLQKPLVNPKQLFTNTNTDNLYIVDQGNNRIVVLQKNGTFVTSYTADILKNAVQIDVHEKEKKIYVLSGDKVWEIGM